MADLDSLDLDGFVESLNSSLDNVEALINQFMETRFEDHVTSQETPTERARVNVSMAYIINSLYFILLKSNGISPKDHPVSAEIERIKKYFQKLQEPKKPSMKLNAEAAQRFIMNNLDNKPMQIDSHEMQTDPIDTSVKASVADDVIIVEKRPAEEANRPKKKKKKNKKKSKQTQQQNSQVIEIE